MPATDLVTFLFDGQRHPLAATVERWLASKRFRAWAEMHRTKIRKKLRGASDADALRDLRFELETAFLLVEERRFSVAYEQYAAEKARGPDLSVTFGSLVFDVEVTRLRPSPTTEGMQPPFDAEYEAARLADTICTKLRQLPAGRVNLLVIVAEEDVVGAVDFTQTMHRLQRQAEQRDPAILARHRFRDPADFFHVFLRLSGVVLRGTWEGDAARPLVLWSNAQAKHPIPSSLWTRLREWGNV